jgi:hypothetical protein
MSDVQFAARYRGRIKGSVDHAPPASHRPDCRRRVHALATHRWILQQAAPNNVLIEATE